MGEAYKPQPLPALSSDAQQKIESLALAALGNIMAITTQAIQQIVLDSQMKIGETIAKAEVTKELV